MSAHPDSAKDLSVASVADAVDVLLHLGALLLRSGNTATRTRALLKLVAGKLGLDTVAVSMSLDSITISTARSEERVTAMREIGPPGVNAWRIAELERFARALAPAASPRAITVKLKEIEAAPPLHSGTLVAACVGLASAGFAFLNGAAAPEMAAAAVGGGFGLWLRHWLSHRQVNQYGSAALAAIAASGVFVLAAALANVFGHGFAHYPAGFIASVLFLVPGVPLIAGLMDLLQYQTVAAVSRVAYAVMILLAVALGLSIVVAVVGVDLSRQPPPDLAYPLKLMFRAVASFVAAAAFAMLFNSPGSAVLTAGLLALAANGLRLVLNDMGMMLAPATFLAALTIGIVALRLERHFDMPLMATAVAPIVIMMPGLYAFEMIVLFNQGHMVEALQATAACSFITGALAMGLATARFFQKAP